MTTSCFCSNTGFICLSRLLFSVLQRIDDSFLRYEAFSRRDVSTRQEIIVQSTALVDSTQGRRGQVELYHFVEDFRINAFDENIWFEGSFGVFHRKGKIVSGSDVLSIVQSPTRSIRTEAALLVVVRVCLLRSNDMSDAVMVVVKRNRWCKLRWWRRWWCVCGYH